MVRSIQKKLKWLIQWPLRRRAIHREIRFATIAKHELAICAIFREEARFMEEWLRFHEAIGATHFYLYNNFSKDDFKTVLAPWIAAGKVTLIDWPVPVGQLSAYRDCCRRAWKECRWIAFVDLDEFLFSPDQVDVRPLLDQYRDLPGIEIFQAFFGSNGHVHRPRQSVIKSYTRRAFLTQTTVKTIVNPRMVYRVGVHQFKYLIGRSLDISRQTVLPKTTARLEGLRINHYWSRSLEDLNTKVARGDASTVQKRDPKWHLEFESKLNQEHDSTILPIAKAIFEVSNPSRLTRIR
jgi:hypothetical protein